MAQEVDEQHASSTLRPTSHLVGRVDVALAAPPSEPAEQSQRPPVLPFSAPVRSRCEAPPGQASAATHASASTPGTLGNPASPSPEPQLPSPSPPPPASPATGAPSNSFSLPMPTQLQPQHTASSIPPPASVLHTPNPGRRVRAPGTPAGSARLQGGAPAPTSHLVGRADVERPAPSHEHGERSPPSPVLSSLAATRSPTPAPTQDPLSSVPSSLAGSSAGLTTWPQSPAAASPPTLQSASAAAAVAAAAPSDRPPPMITAASAAAPPARLATRRRAIRVQPRPAPVRLLRRAHPPQRHSISQQAAQQGSLSPAAAQPPQPGLRHVRRGSRVALALQHTGQSLDSSLKAVLRRRGPTPAPTLYGRPAP
jgi:hypothetical protein